MLNSINKNKNWIFGGIGIYILSFLFRILFNYFSDKPDISIYKTSIATLIVLLGFMSIFGLINFFIKISLPVYIKNKIEEFIVYIFGKHKNKLPNEVQYNCFKAYDHHKRVIDVFNSMMCRNQGELVEFILEAGNLHKGIKREIYNKTKPDVSYLIKACNFLENEINIMTEKFYDNTCETILKYFEGRDDEIPRICVKHFEEGHIKDTFRRPMEQYISEGPVIKADSGCLQVVQQGYEYLINNIPLGIKNNTYYNPRIDSLDVQNYLHENKKFSNFQDWMRCWIDIIIKNSPLSEQPERTMRPSKNSCYMSSLVIPMTLLKRQISKKVRSHFNVPKVVGNDNSRAIYGLLCFDHVNIDYFNRDTDVKAGYFFADIYSLFIIYGLMYTKYSKSFKKAKNIIKLEGCYE